MKLRLILSSNYTFGEHSCSMMIFAVHPSNLWCVCVRAREEGGGGELRGAGMVLCFDTLSIQSKFLKVANKEANDIPKNKEKGSICRFRMCQEWELILILFITLIKLIKCDNNNYNFVLVISTHVY